MFARATCDPVLTSSVTQRLHQDDYERIVDETPPPSP